MTGDKILSAAMDIAEQAVDAKTCRRYRSQKRPGARQIDEVLEVAQESPPPPIVPPRASWGLTEAELAEGYAQDSARPA